jgi:RNA polymerase sigma-70 factor (ECF subfamily)
MNLTVDQPVRKAGCLSHDDKMVIRENSTILKDATLVRGCVKGNEEALSTLYFRYSAIILNHLYRMVHNRIEAEDLTEETFFRVWSKASLYDERKGSFKTWLFRMASRLAINRLRKTSRREKLSAQIPLMDQDVEDNSTSPVASAHASESRKLVHRALSTLKEKDRAIISLRHFEGIGEHEVAEILGIPKGTVKSRTYYAVRRLKSALESLGFNK